MAESASVQRTGPILLLDIGSTLVDGPRRGPATGIAESLGFDDEQRRALRDALMTTELETPEAACALLESHFAVDPVAARSAMKKAWEAQSRAAQPVPGALAALERFRAEGWRLGLVSNIWQPYFCAVRRYFGAFFDACIPPRLQLLSYRFGARKPGPGIFLAALDRAAVRPAEAVMVGDSYFDDIQPAAKLGISTVWVQSRPRREEDAMSRVGNESVSRPTLTVPSLDALDSQLLPCAP
jgi:HAD superfamily hydrolase (TIGR01509 family)